MSASFDLSSLAARYAAGDAATDVIRDVYQRIKADSSSAVWISIVEEEVAVERVRSAPRGPLYGIPFAVKDNINVAGLPTTCACPAFAHVPARSATVVERLEAAGAIVIGKTNLDQFATGLVGTRSPYGIPRNAFDPDFISGGSSSGSAVAVAKGFVSFALGTDTAGSGRVPAGFNNLVGLKPTKGLVSTRGVVPACRSLDVVSIFALTSSDAARVLEVAGGFDTDDAFSRAAPGIGSPPVVGKLRIGIPAGELEFFGDKEYARLFDEATARAASLGFEIVPIDFRPFCEAARLLYSGPWVAERLAAIKDFATRVPDALHDVVGRIILGAKELSAVGAFEGLYRLAELTRAAEAEWSKMDVLMLPTSGTVYRVDELLADPIQLNSNLGTYTNFVNLMDLSALAVPQGFRADGLPFGVTLIGRAFDDPRLAQIGDRLHRALGDVTVGATTTALASLPAVAPHEDNVQCIKVAVVGAHLTGQPLHWQLTERKARYCGAARTAEGYRFYALANTTPAKPGLVFDGKGEGLIEVEIWEMDQAAFGSFVALIPAPLGIGTLRLEDGSSVKGFICESHATEGAIEITRFGGWRNWLNRP
ncbi:MAG: allophanate hydrolase [Hyphomicrobium sp.]|nr:allophanate hydrolase [Hyphomicrobium sp.]